MTDGKGCIHIYCGDGKGKTSAAIGLAVRAAGRGRRVLIARFLKTDDSGEVAALPRITGIEILPCVKTFGFYFQMTEQQKKEAEEYYGALLEKAWLQVAKGGYDMLILDEIMAACSCRLVSEERLLRYLQEKPAELEVVMTGRDPSPQILNTADYISEIYKRRHPFDSGIGAREGIEY